MPPEKKANLGVWCILLRRGSLAFLSISEVLMTHRRVDARYYKTRGTFFVSWGAERSCHSPL